MIFHFLEEDLPMRLLLGVGLLVIRETQLEGDGYSFPVLNSDVGLSYQIFQRFLKWSIGIEYHSQSSLDWKMIQ